MDHPTDPVSLEEMLNQWRRHARGRGVDEPADVAAREVRLRAEIDGLMRVGLAADEAFFVAVKRVGEGDRDAADFARGQMSRASAEWSAIAADPGRRSAPARAEAIIAFGLALLAAAAVKVPALFGFDVERNGAFYARNAALFVLPGLVGYFAWKRSVAAGVVRWLAAAFVVAAVAANLPWVARAHEFATLTGLHLPIALLLPLGIAYSGRRWGEPAGRMDFVRFLGQLFIFYVLIALGGGVLCGLLAVTFSSIGIRLDSFLGDWLVPCGAAGAVMVAGWLVETKKAVIENMAPVLTRLFTPLFAAMLLAFLGAVLLSGRGLDLRRETLIGFDLVLVVVLGLLLYSLSARNPHSGPGWFDVLQVVLLASALLADAVALWAIGGRIGDFGFSPNRVAALGENVILLVNLVWSAVLYVRFLRARGTIADLERWQTRYLPVYAAWAAIVVLLFPAVFRRVG